MGQPPTNAVYDFNAAYMLLQELAVARDKVRGLATLRGQQRHSLLGGPHSDNWQGPRRDAFEREFGPEQRRLGALADDLMRLIRAVENATNRAHTLDSASAAS